MLLDVQPSLIDLSDFDCVLCYRTLWKPVVTPCGHTYCMVSLEQQQQQKHQQNRTISSLIYVYVS